MIKEINHSELGIVINLLELDKARNYFILLTLGSRVNLFEKIYGEWEDNELVAVLLKRKSGTLQFYSKGSFDIDGLINLISNLDYDTMIGPKSYCDKFLDMGIFSSFKEGAYISKRVNTNRIKRSQYNEVKSLDINQLDNVIKLYDKVFESYAAKEIMMEKLLSGRGRGVYVNHGENLISVAQSDFETVDSSLIVGVATDPMYQNQGLATKCLEVLIEELDRDLYLQYDNLAANRVYEKLGFRVIDRVRHYRK